MQINLRNVDGAVVLTPEGRIDHSSADAFQVALAQHLEQCRSGTPMVVLDMSHVDYISSVGLRVLMMAAKQVKAQEGRIAVAALTPMVSEVFAISRFNLVLDVHDSVAAAVAHKGTSG